MRRLRVTARLIDSLSALCADGACGDGVGFVFSSMTASGARSLRPSSPGSTDNDGDRGVLLSATGEMRDVSTGLDSRIESEGVFDGEAATALTDRAIDAPATESDFDASSEKVLGCLVEPGLPIMPAMSSPTSPSCAAL